MRIRINLLGWELDFSLEPQTTEYEEESDPVSAYGSLGSIPIYVSEDVATTWYQGDEEEDDREIGFPRRGKK